MFSLSRECFFRVVESWDYFEDRVVDGDHDVPLLLAALDDNSRTELFVNLARKGRINDNNFEIFIHEYLGRLKLSGIGGLIGDKSIEKVVEICSHLRDISLYSLSNVSPFVLASLWQNVPKLEGANFAKCPIVNHLVLSSLSTHCSTLQRLILNRDVRIDDSILTNILPNLTQLNELAVYGLPLVTDSTINCIALHNTNLTSLNISRSGVKLDKSIENLVKNCCNLSVFRLARLRGLNDPSLVAITQHLSKTLQILDVSFITFSVSVVEDFISTCTPLEILFFPRILERGCVGDQLLELAAKCLPNLKSIHYPSHLHTSSEGLLKFVKSCANFEVMALNRSRITGEIVEEILNNNSRLEEVFLSGCDNFDSALSSANFCVSSPMQLRALELNKHPNLLDDEFVGYLGRYYNGLEELQLSASIGSISNRGIQEFSNRMINLCYLNISHSPQVTDQFVEILVTGRLRKSLANLVLSGCKVTHRVIPVIFKNLINLHHLCFFTCSEVGVPQCKIPEKGKQKEDQENTQKQKEEEKEKEKEKGKEKEEEEETRNEEEEKDLEEFEKEMENVKSCISDLNLGRCPFLKPRVLKIILGACPYLQSLRISSCFALNDCSKLNTDILEIIRTQTPILSTLRCSYITSFNDHNLMSLVDSCAQLSTLNLSGCVSITDRSISHILQHCSLLQCLHVTHCKRVTNKSITILLDPKKSVCSLLTQLSLTDSGISNELAARIRKQFPYMVLHYNVKAVAPKKTVKKKGTSLEEWRKMQENRKKEEQQQKLFNDLNYWKIQVFDDSDLQELD